ncbi:hypothetical protein [Desulfopila aestuarii]|uniref:Uncharacterized protein n=1 Tax=Desulfopila aestuarii DSM 18488 TaxID=1121416 RepID=A0A1M7YH16_9BACT|nr:hypothetical protein [Desulfopila aestuarii]SHO51954.1 hypothetical protein SAMN02745220_04301 [Desulfopila aestuarii DSM 18488]
MQFEDNRLDYKHLDWLKKTIKPRTLWMKVGVFYTELVNIAKGNIIVSFGETPPDLIELLRANFEWEVEEARALLLFYCCIGTVKITKTLPGDRRHLESAWCVDYKLDEFEEYTKRYEENTDYYMDIIQGRITIDDLREIKRLSLQRQ